MYPLECFWDTGDHSGQWEIEVKQVQITCDDKDIGRSGWKLLGVRNKVYCVFPGPVISCGCPASHWNSSLRKWTTGNSIHSPLRVTVSAVEAAVAAGDAATEQKAWESCVGLSWSTEGSRSVLSLMFFDFLSSLERSPVIRNSKAIS